MDPDYQLHRLTTPEEVSQWASFCASCFAYKSNPPPPSYFLRHFHNDPDRNPNLILVVFYGKNMVASTRIFLKRCKNKRVGGIGEVCTSPQHRRRGLAKCLLEEAIRIMREECHLDCSVLHASESFWEVYRKVGYKNVCTGWSCLTLPKSVEARGSIRLANPEENWKVMKSIHAVYSEDRFAGCIVRSDNYWNQYLFPELEGKLYVMEEKEKLIAWISMRFRNDTWQMIEFGKDPSATPSTFCVLAAFWKEIVPDQVIKLPTLIVKEMQSQDESCLENCSIRADDDWGWMYLKLNGDGDVVDQFRENHLIWPSDSF